MSAAAVASGATRSGAANLSRPPASPEYAVKSAFIYNFARFVEWPEPSPAAAGAEVNVCVLGTDPFGPTLDEALAGKAVGGRPIAVERIATVREAERCAVVFVAASEAHRLRAVLDGLRAMPVLTVGDLDGFAEAGGIIGMFIENQRVRFEINVGAAERAHLRISSRLLGLARIVGRAPAKDR